MVSVSKRHWMVWLVVLSLLLVACERPFQSDSTVPEAPDTGGEATGIGGEEATTDTGGETTTGEEATGGEETGTGEGEATGEETGEGEETAETTGAGEATGEETTGETTEGETAEGETTGEESAGETTEGETAEGETTEEEAAGETAEESGEAEETTTPDVHVVEAGDTLYKIGLKYGISWVTLAEFNDLSNPNRLKVGQEINIPSSDDTAEPTPSPQTEEIYVVKAGDNLYRIGLAHEISWVQIAEANGLMNPNYLVVGQQIKIPTSAPGPDPQFTHTVRRGQTLFSISLQYGVAWTAIAEANDIESPHVIFPGQMLIIPGD